MFSIVSVPLILSPRHIDKARQEMHTTRSKSLFSRTLVAAALSFSSLTAFAYIDIPNPAPVVDLTGTLSDLQKQTLTNEIQDLDARSGSDVEMLVLPSTDGETIQSYSWRVAEAWRPDHAGANRGLVVVIAKNDHHSYIQVGRGLESVINNDVATQLAKNMSPYFRQGDFYGGLTQNLNDLASLIAAPQSAGPANTVQDSGQVNNASVPQQSPAEQIAATPAAAVTTPAQPLQAATAKPDNGPSLPQVLFIAVLVLGPVGLFYCFFLVPKRSKNRKHAASLYSTSSPTSRGFSPASPASSSTVTSSSASKPASTVRPAGPSTPASSSVTPATPRSSNKALFGSDFSRNPRTSTPEPRRAATPEPRRTSAPDARRASAPNPRRSSLSSTNMRTSSSSSSASRTSSSVSRSSSDDGYTAGYIAGSLSNNSRTSDYYSRNDDTPTSTSWGSSSNDDAGGSFGGTGGGASWDDN